MIPGEYFITDGSLEINSKSNTFSIEIINEGDRPIQVGSHFHFAEVNAFLKFDRDKLKILNFGKEQSIFFVLLIKKSSSSKELPVLLPSGMHEIILLKNPNSIPL